MGKYCDFVVPYSKDPKAIAESIIRNICLNRLKYHKPTIILVAGDSGEAKSYNTLRILEVLCKEWGIELKDYLNDLIIFTPYEYATKMDNLLYDPRLKKVKAVVLDEAREVIDAKNWYEFSNRAIAHINAMFRRIKPMVVFIVTQYIGDVDASVRRTLTFYAKSIRPLGQKPHLYLYRTWKDDYDLENPKLRRRRVFGYVKKGGRRIKFYPSFRLNKPSKEVIEIYEKLNYNAKTKIIKMKLNAILKRLGSEVKAPYAKLDAIIDFYVKKPDTLNLILEKRRGKSRLKKDVAAMHELNQDEIKEFEIRLFEKMKKGGLIYGDKENKDLNTIQERV